MSEEDFRCNKYKVISDHLGMELIDEINRRIKRENHGNR